VRRVQRIVSNERMPGQAGGWTNPDASMKNPQSLGLIMDFFTWETFWGASAMLKAIYWGRLLLLCLPLVASLTVVDAIRSWPRDTETGEEHLVLQREFRIVDERNREVQKELKEGLAATRQEVQALQFRQARFEEKFDVVAKMLGAMCCLLIGQFVIPLLKLGLRREITRIKEEGGLKR